MASSLMQTLLSLVAVLALIAALAWLLKRVQRPQTAAGNPIRLRGQIMVGPRERVVVLEIGDQWIVAGVAAGNVQQLAVLPRQEPALPQDGDDAASKVDFNSILARLRKPAR